MGTIRNRSSLPMWAGVFAGPSGTRDRLVGGRHEPAGTPTAAKQVGVLSFGSLSTGRRWATLPDFAFGFRPGPWGEEA